MSRTAQRSFFLAALVLSMAASAMEEPQTVVVSGSGDAPVLDNKEALRVSQAAIGRSIQDHALLNREGQPVRLSGYRGKPLLVNFIYTGCFQFCPTTTRSLDKAVATAQQILGENSFNTVTIGFNQPFDSPQALKAYASQHGIRRPGWEFLSPHPKIVDELTKDFGFSYVKTSGGFDHVNQVTIVDADGKIYRQTYGDTFPVKRIVEPLRELIAGRPVAQITSIDELINQIRVICTVYDPKSGRYKTDYKFIMEVAGGVTFFIAVMIFFYRELRGRWKRPLAGKNNPTDRK